MQISTTITLGVGEYAGDLKGNSEELATAILRVVGGNPTKDICNVLISDSGQAGSYPMTPPSPTVEPEPTPVAASAKKG